jgi:hypothetical protein
MDDQTPRRLFHALVLMGAALTGGAAACRSDNTSEPLDAAPDAALDAPPQYYADIHVVEQELDAPPDYYADIHAVPDEELDAPPQYYPDVHCVCEDTGIDADGDAQEVDARDVYGNISIDGYSWEASEAPTGDDAADGG